MTICICGPEWRNPGCDLHGNHAMRCVACEHCGKPIATPEDGEMRFDDPRVALLCWSDEDQAKFCDKDPRRPGAPHRRDCRCDDCHVDQEPDDSMSRVDKDAE